MSSSEAAPVVLTAELRDILERAFDEKATVVVAAVGPQGEPLVSFRSSLKPYGESRLSFWARKAHGATMDALDANPRVAVLLRSPSVPMLQFRGRARIVQGEAERRRIYDAMPEPERKADAERKGAAVVVDLEQVDGVLRLGADGPVYCRLP
jgi:hypothetical protein